MQTCSRCEIPKDDSCFYKRKERGTLRTMCKECQARMAAVYYRNNKEKHRVASRRYSLKKCYGISLEDYNARVVRAGGKCEVCRQVKPLVVDHDHATGKFRGLLCHNCNTAIGLLYENLNYISAAFNYVEAHT